MSHFLVNLLASWPKAKTMLAGNFFTMNTYLRRQLQMLPFIKFFFRKVSVTGSLNSRPELG